jgi:hypothetical protein
MITAKMMLMRRMLQRVFDCSMTPPPPTKEKGDEDDNNDTSGVDVEYDKENAHSQEIDLTTDAIEKKHRKEGYKKQWGK